MFKMDLERQRKQRSNCQHTLNHRKSNRIRGKKEHFCFIETLKPLTVWIKTNCGKFLKRWEYQITLYFNCLLRNLYTGQKATVRTRHGTRNWFQIGKGVHQGCILSPCLFNFYAEYIMQNAGLDEAQAGIKISGRHINYLRFAMTPPSWQKAKRN